MKFDFDVETERFESFVSNAAKEMDGEQFWTFIRGIALSFISIVVPLTPVDTGRARAAWTTGLRRLKGKGTRIQIGGTAAGRAQGIKDGEFRENKAMGRRIIEIFNGVAYIVPLELGHSAQARAGMVRLAMRKMTQTLLNDSLDATKKAIARANYKTRSSQLRLNRRIRSQIG